MRLFIQNGKTKVELAYPAENRTELAKMIGSNQFTHGSRVYSVDEVQAEPSSNSVVPTFVGAFVGVLGGGVGVAIGGAVGAIVGESLVKEDKRKVIAFNDSHAVRMG